MLLQPEGKLRPRDGPSAMFNSDGIQRVTILIFVARDKHANLRPTCNKLGDEERPFVEAKHKDMQSTRSERRQPKLAANRKACLTAKKRALPSSLMMNCGE